MSAIGTDIAAIGTVSALIFLGIQAWRLGQQTAELRRQTNEESEARRREDERRQAQAERERMDRHLSQARLIAAFMGPVELVADAGSGVGRTAVDLVNGSDEPVYRLVVAIVFIQGAAPKTIQEWLELRQMGGREGAVTPPAAWQAVMTLAILPKGTYRVWFPGTGWSAILSGRNGAEVSFTDRAGANWIRRATGQLEEIEEEPLQYFGRWGLHAPYDLRTPERLD